MYIDNFYINCIKQNHTTHIKFLKLHHAENFNNLARSIIINLHFLGPGIWKKNNNKMIWLLEIYIF